MSNELSPRCGDIVAAQVTSDGLDARVIKSNSAVSFNYRRAGAGATDPVLAQSFVVTGGPTNTTNYTPGISSFNTNSSSFNHQNWLGSNELDTDSSQNTITSRQYDAFGNLLSGSATTFGYAGGWGYQQDSDSGLQLLGHRYYDATAGRFLSRDPIKAGENWYVYADAGPTRFVDPSGLTVRYWSLHKWIGTGGPLSGDGFASDEVYEDSLNQIDSTLGNWWGHFKG